MNLRIKVDGLSFQQRLWIALRGAKRPMSHAEVAKAMGVKWEQVRKAMWCLVDGGFVVTHGGPPEPWTTRRFSAGKCMPPDLRGTRASSLRNLKYVSDPKGYVHRADSGYGRRRGWHVKPRPKTELERAMGWGV